MPEYLDKLQLLAFFLVSYLLSRIFVRFQLPQRLIHWLFQEKRLTVSRLNWLIIIGTAVLSMLIANVVTLLTLIPVLVLLQKDYRGPSQHSKRFSTMVMLSAMWGSNIGGMGMLTGTPANGLLIAMFQANRFAINKQFTFLSWMTWGIPLTLVLCFLGWLVMMLVFRPARSFGNEHLKPGFVIDPTYARAQNIALVLAFVFLISSALLSFAMSFLHTLRLQVLLVTAIWTLGFLYVMFMHRFRTTDEPTREPLLRGKDILHDLPKKGFLWILLGLGLTGLLIWLKFPDQASRWAAQWISADRSLLLLMLSVALITTFLTEIVSNTVVLISMFVALFPLTKDFPGLSWQIMLIISLSSNCAFMSPLATPSNGLGFGSSHKISLRFMLLSGFLMNVVCAVAITLWVHYLVPPVISLFA